MQKLVIDSSVIVKWLNQQDEERLAQADKILKDVEEKQVILFAPELAKYEIGNALLFRKKLVIKDALVTFCTLFTFPIQFIPQSEALATETYKIAHDLQITYYDASFLALAQQEKATLITDNPKHQRKTSKIIVIPLENY